MLNLQFQSGTLLLWDDNAGTPNAPLEGVPANLCRYDDRVQKWRAPASNYAAIVSALYRGKISYNDQARAYQCLNLNFSTGKQPRSYQQEAVAAWEKAHRRGVVVLPTGTGKSFVAQCCIAKASRSTIVIVPTLDLLSQWVLQLKYAFHCEIGILGGGSHDIRDITVSTYDSALIMMENIGGRFGLMIVDECHHLPGPMYSQIARFAIAPWRLGLTATPERNDGLHSVYAELMGPICFRREITDADTGNVLSNYDIQTLDVDLDPDEQEDYDRCHNRYVDFLRRNRISFSTPQGWGAFLQACYRQPDGRDAFNAYLQQRKIARSPRAKIRLIWELLKTHRHDRVLIFTADNPTAYHIGTLFGLPVITHHTAASERCAFLDAFRNGTYPVLVTSKVLNEGVDVPEANIGIVVSGSGSVREHVQRLGRILRPQPGKSATLYELVSLGTSESYVSERRRQHPAYGGEAPAAAATTT